MQSIRRLVTGTTLLLVLPIWAACSSGDEDPTGPTPSISVAVVPGSLSIEQGQNDSFTVTLTRSGGFNDAVAISITGLPSGVTASSASIAAGETQGSVTLTAAANAAIGSTDVTVQASGIGVSPATAALSLTITEAPASTFQLSLAPASLSIEQGQSATSTITIDRAGGFQGTVDLAISGAPTGLTTTLGSAAVNGGQTTLDVTASGSLAPGTYTLTVTGTGNGTPARTADLGVTVSQSGGGGGAVQAAWTFCADSPVWFAVSDGTGGPWTRVTPSGATFDFEVTADDVSVAYVMDAGAGGTELEVLQLGAEELEAIGESFCAEAGTKSVTVSAQPLSATQTASVSLGPSSTTIFGAAGPSGTLENLPDGELALFGARSEINTGTGASEINRFYLERGLNPAAGSTLNVDFAGSNSFDPVTNTATITNLAGDTAFLSIGFSASGSTTFLGLASFGAPSASTSRPMPLVPAAQQQAGDFHILNLTAFPSTISPTVFRSVIRFFSGAFDQQVPLGPEINTPMISGDGTASFYQPRVEYARQTEYDRYWSADFDQDSRSVTWTVTDNYLGSGAFDLTFPDLSGAAGWNDTWALQAGGSTVNASFSALGWSTPGSIFPETFTDGLTIQSGVWTGSFNPN